MKKVLELYRRLEDWEQKDFFIYFDDMRITTNNYTVYIFIPLVICLIILASIIF